MRFFMGRDIVAHYVTNFGIVQSYKIQIFQKNCYIFPMRNRVGPRTARERSQIQMKTLEEYKQALWDQPSDQSSDAQSNA